MRGVEGLSSTGLPRLVSACVDCWHTWAKGQRDKGTKELENFGKFGSLELWNLGAWEFGNLGT